MFVLFIGFNWRLKSHESEICRSSIHFCCGSLYFLVSEPNSYFSLCFLQRSNGFFAWSYFSMCKCFKWRVQPQSSFLSSKKSSLAMLFLFFLHFICSSSSVHHLSFVYSLQLKTTNTFMLYFPMIFFFFCPNLFFLVSQPNWYGSLCFLLRSNGFLASSYVSGF